MRYRASLCSIPLLLSLRTNVGVVVRADYPYRYNTPSGGGFGLVRDGGWFGAKTALAAAAAAVVVRGCVHVVTSGDECLVERLGVYHRRLGPGWHWIWRPIETVSFHTTVRERVLDITPQQCYTLDNAPLRADAVVYLRVVDTFAARYRVEDVRLAIVNLCLTQLREEVGKLTLDESFSSRERINAALLTDLNRVCRDWGVEITRVELQNLEPSKDILAAMELQMAAERRKRAAVLRSEGERTTTVNEAEGRALATRTEAAAARDATVLAAEAERQRQRVEAEGVRDAIRTVAEAIDDGNDERRDRAVEAAVQFLGLLRYLETQGRFAANGNNSTKVIMLPSKDSLPLTYGGLKFLAE